MTDPNRRTLLGGIIGSAGVAVAAGTVQLVPPSAGQSNLEDPVAATVLHLLADLGQAIRSSGAASPDLLHLLTNGATFAAIGLGDFLIERDPVRAIAMAHARYHDTNLRLPIQATFSGEGTKLRIASLRIGPADPFDATRALATIGDNGIPGDAIDLQVRYDLLAAKGGGVLSLPPGLFATNLRLHSRHVHIAGAGRGATRLVPLDQTQPVLRALYREGSWNYVTIANLDIVGKDGQGIGFAAGADAYVTGDEFAGRTRFVNVGFADLSCAIRRDAGQIGLSLDQCTFASADYHLYSTANQPGRGEIMHAGVLSARDCHFTGARSAVAYLDSPVAGTGAVLFDNCIMERNPGFVFYIPAFANVDATTDFVVRDCWNERNAIAGRTEVNGTDLPVCYGYFANAAMVRFDGTPLGPLKLRNTSVDTYRCPLDNLSSVDRDGRSTIRHHEARGFGSYAPIGMVIGLAAALQNDPPGRALSFVLPPRTRLTKLRTGQVLQASSARDPFVLVGSVSVTTRSEPEGGLPGVRASQRVALRRGMEIFPPPAVVPPGSWLAWLFVYRLASGQAPFFQVSGDRGISTRRRLAASEWETLGGMAEIAPGANEISLWMIQEGEASEIVLGGYNLVAFPTRQAALDFLNSGDFAVR